MIEDPRNIDDVVIENPAVGDRTRLLEPGMYKDVPPIRAGAFSGVIREKLQTMGKVVEIIARTNDAEPEDEPVRVTVIEIGTDEKEGKVLIEVVGVRDWIEASVLIDKKNGWRQPIIKSNGSSSGWDGPENPISKWHTPSQTAE